MEGEKVKGNEWLASCEHCGGALRYAPESAGQVTQCPLCQAETTLPEVPESVVEPDPVAESPAATPPPPKPPKPPQRMVLCKHCSKTIGYTESQLGELVKCPHCKEVQALPKSLRHGTLRQPKFDIPKGNMVCPCCGYIGLPNKVPRGGGNMFLFLLALGLAGILIFAVGGEALTMMGTLIIWITVIIFVPLEIAIFLRLGYRYRCPHCSFQIAVDN